MALYNFSSSIEDHPALQNHPRFRRIIRDLRYGIHTSATKTFEFYSRQGPVNRILLVIAGLAFLTIIVLFAIYRESVLELLVSFADALRALQYGPFILGGLVVGVSFPPLIGYSMLSSLCGMMYGFWGWPLLAGSTVLGSMLSFLACRFLFKDYALRLARSNAKFAALTGTMQGDGIWLLMMIRLCPLPYSLSNGALASVHTISVWRFGLATAMATPKLFLHIFVGDRLVKITTETDPAAKVINIISMSLAIILGPVTAYLIYIKTVERVEQNEAYQAVELENSTSPDPERDSFDIEDEDFENQR